MNRLQQVFRCLLLCALLACVITVPAAALSDVPDDFWAKEDIDRCVSFQYFYPESDGSFGVGKEMSRAEFLVVLCRYFGWKPASPARVIYEDVSEKAWYAGPVETAYHQGAITNQDGRFRPDDPITRDEAAAMLVRALGYGSITGLIQDMPLPFRDIQANNGYIIMAYGMGLMDGTSVTAFSPEEHVTREQAAVIIMRLHDKLHGTAARTGITSSVENLPDMKGYEAVCIAAAKLAYNGEPQISPILKEEETAAIRTAVTAAGSKPLLYITGGTYHLREGDSEKMAEVLLQAVKDEKCQGLFLDISGLTTTTQCKELIATAQLLREGLKDQLLYIGVQAPSWKGTIFGYDYAALGEIADRLILRFDQEEDTAGDYSLAPLEPLEKVYFSLSRLRGVVDANKITLLLTSTASEWDGKNSTPITGQKLTDLMGEQRARTHYSSRYACAYLTREGEDTNTIWYLNGQSIQERVRLAQLFGGGHICLSDLNSALPEVLKAMP